MREVKKEELMGVICPTLEAEVLMYVVGCRTVCTLELMLALRHIDKHH